MRVLLAALAVTLALPAVAAAEPPPNDHYLQSTRLDDAGRMPEEPVVDDEDTREATEQADLFSPPRAGGGPEATRCGALAFGKTVWYDLMSDEPGVLRIRATGFDAAIAAYDYDPRTSALRRQVMCRRGPEALLPVARGVHYTLQVGGVDGAAGLLLASFELLPDRDRDTVADALDACPDVPGPGGCSRPLRARVRMTWSRTDEGIRVKRLTVGGLAGGAQVDARCRRRCSLRDTREPTGVGRARTVELRRFAGRTLPAGARIEVRITQPQTIGVYTRFDVRRAGVRRTVRCLPAGSRTPRRRCGM